MSHGFIPRAPLGRAAAAFAAVFALGLSAHATDTDGDGLVDIADNCIDIANADQRDTDADFFGNACDADLNNDNVVNVVDLGLLRARFFSDDADADFNGDGVVNVVDLGIMRQQFFVAPGPSGVALANTPLQFTQVFGNTPLVSALAMRQAPNDPSRWYFLERAGRIVSVAADGSSTAVHEVISLPQVDTEFEGGALGFDFHPDFANNGHVYVSYTADGPNFAVPLISRISRFDTSVDPLSGELTADLASEVVVYALNQPFANHNGGNILFGLDGYLYFGLGDGGSGGDPQNHGQRLETPLGAMLRIDVDVTQADFDNGVRYYIPPDNPFAGAADCSSGTCPEIYAYGMRNPWRFSFDRATGDLWVGDVGQDAREEISLVVNGGNYGWRCREGSIAFNTAGCGPVTDYIEPVHDYAHSLGFSVAGGYVYRGSEMPSLDGMYFFSDVFSGRLWGIYRGDFAGEFFDSSLNIVSFGEALDGELYVMSGANVYRLEMAP